MSLKARLRVVLACVVLQAGVFSGVPMPPEKVQQLLQTLNVPKVAHVLPTEDDEGGSSP